MSIKAITRVWDDSSAKGSELLLLLAMADYADDDLANIFPAISTLAHKTRLSERQVQRIIVTMVAEGCLRKDSGGGRGKTNVYAIVLPEKGVNLSSFTEKGDIQGSKRVTSRVVKGDIVVSPDPLDPSLDPDLPPIGGGQGSSLGESSPDVFDEPPPPTPKPAKEDRDAMWDAYTEATGITPVTKADRSNLGQIVRDTLEAGITPRQVKAATKQARLDWERESMITWRAIYHNIGPLLKRSRERKERDSQPIV